MKYLLFLILFAGLSIPAADGLYAIVKGTNVLAVWQFGAARPPRALTNAPFAGSTNVPITELEHSTIQKGWTYSGGVFRDPAGKAIANGVKSRVDRQRLLLDTIADLDQALDNWDALSAAQQKAVLKRLVQVERIRLVERREEFEIKEDPK